MAISNFAYVYADAIVNKLRTYDSVLTKYKADTKVALHSYVENGVITSMEYENFVGEAYII